MKRVSWIKVWPEGMHLEVACVDQPGQVGSGIHQEYGQIVGDSVELDFFFFA